MCQIWRENSELDNSAYHNFTYLQILWNRRRIWKFLWKTGDKVGQCF